MGKFLIRLIGLGLLAGLATGCYFAGFNLQVRTTVIAPGGQAPGGPATPVLPVIQLEHGGSVIPGLATGYEWRSPGGSSGGSYSSGSWPPRLPATLEAQVGNSVNVIFSMGPPAAVTLTEFDSQGVPVNVTSVIPTGNRLAYSLSTSGHYILQVHGQWSYDRYVTYLFDLHIQP